MPKFKCDILSNFQTMCWYVPDRQTVVGTAKLATFEGNANLSLQMSYGVPLKQLEELMRLSESCNQEFQWDCYFAPLEVRGEKLLTWTDRSGASQSYFHGNGSDDQSQCECATTNTCAKAFTVDYKCNCNSRVPVAMQDKGTVFENHRKRLIQHCERSDLRLHFEWTKVY